METNAAFDYEQMKQIGRSLLLAIGENPDRPGLADTPRRFADAWREFIDYQPGNHETTFESVSVDQMVIVKRMRVWSFCEHHLLPFFCDVSIGYITQDRVLGLSKFGRIAQKYAHKLQLQERLVSEIAADVIVLTGSQDVAVLAQGEHLCMTMRGIKMPSVMISSSMNGKFRTIPEARAEFLELVK